MGQLGILKEDKRALIGFGALCIIQNYMFFLAYHDIWKGMHSESGVCDRTETFQIRAREP